MGVHRAKIFFQFPLGARCQVQNESAQFFDSRSARSHKGGVPPVGRDIGDYTVCDPRFVATQSWNPIRRKPIFRLAVEVQAAPIRTEAGRPFTRRMIRNAQGLATFQLHEVDIRVLAGLSSIPSKGDRVAIA